MHVDLEATLALKSAVKFVSNNATEGDGGAIHGASAGNVSLVNTTFERNHAKGRGGGVVLLLYHEASIDGCYFHGNTGSNGGGLWSGTGFGEMIITDSVFEENFAGARMSAWHSQQDHYLYQIVDGGQPNVSASLSTFT